MQPLSYQSTGVNYDVLDKFKLACQRAAGRTVDLLAAHGVSEPAGIRGESAYLVETPEEFLAHVEEGLGTKNLVADALLDLHPAKGADAYFNIGIDTVGAIVNDLLTVGALPMVVAMHAAVGSAAWFKNESRAKALADGFAEGCRRAGAVWGGGETPALKGLVQEQTIILAGSAMGRIRPKNLRIAGNVQTGDAMVFLASSGVHANGLTLCRELAARLPQGYLTSLEDGRSYAETLLDASIIYSPFIAACQAAKLDLHYAVHMTGHGWRKLMRLAEPFVYRCTHLARPCPPIFDFIARSAHLDSREMYGTFNMGVGFAVYLPAEQAAQAVELAEQFGQQAWIGGTVEKHGPRKAVLIEPLGLAYEAETLQIR
jgi:phosphoribosylformylglycinamidine cyclo-ligase